MSVPAARIRTANGWRDLAIQGAMGPAGRTPNAKAHSTNPFTLSADANWRFYTPPLTTDWDDFGNSFTANPGKFTAVVAGRYLIGFMLHDLTGGNVGIMPLVNSAAADRGLTSAMPQSASGVKAGVEHWSVYNLNAGNTVELYAWHSAGGSPTLYIEAIQLAGASGIPPGAPLLVSALPVNPTDGTEVYYLADAANGVIWHLRYRAAAPGSYKWEFVGGPALFSPIIVPYDGIAVGAGYVNLATDGPSLTAPLAGDYIAEFGGDLRAAGGYFASAGVAWGSAAQPNDDEAAWNNANATTAKIIRHNGVAAGTVCKLKYSAGGAGCYIGRRWMTLRPVRVG